MAVTPNSMRCSRRVAALTAVLQARVAIGDEIGERLGARLVARPDRRAPCLTSPDSLGIYLTWNPRPGRTDAERNCISNVRTEGIGYTLAAHKLHFLMQEARARKLSGLALKEDMDDRRVGPLNSEPEALSDGDKVSAD